MYPSKRSTADSIQYLEFNKDYLFNGVALRTFGIWIQNRKGSEESPHDNNSRDFNKIWSNSDPGRNFWYTKRTIIIVFILMKWLKGAVFS